MTFTNRADAGRRLADALSAYAASTDLTVLGLPRGGVPVAFEVARSLNAPLDVCLVRKLGVPGHPELAMGAIAEGGVEIRDAGLIAELAISEASIHAIVARERVELARRIELYRGGRPIISVRDRTVILVDDGLATGATMEAAVTAVRSHGPRAIVVAVPVGAPEACRRIGAVADQMIYVHAPNAFQAVGLWYDVFDQTSDEEVRRLLRESARAGEARPGDA